MKKNYLLFVALLATTLSFAQGSEDFTNSAATSSYANGSFVGNNGVTWTYTESRSAVSNGGGLPSAAQLPALMLRRSSDNSKIVSSSVSGGIQDFSVKLYKQFTGGGNRQVELFINGSSVGTSTPFDDYNEHIFSVTGINITGPVTVELRNITSKQIAIDDILWTPMGGGGAVVDTIATISSVDASVLENVGTVDVNITLNQIPVLDKTIDLTLTSGNSTVIGGFTTQAITFVGGGAQSQTVTLNITPGQLSSASEIFDFMLTNPSTGLEIGADTTFQLTINQLPVNPSPCSDLYFSEYVEGGGFNKALEIYNPTTNSIDLSNYSIERYDGGSATVNETLILEGTLAAGAVYVIASNNNATNIAIKTIADTLTSFCSHNGDDAYILNHSGNQIDVIGETTGVDPGSSWSVGSGSTKDKTLVRNSTVTNGELTWLGAGNMQWDVHPKDDFSFLGSHTTNGCQVQSTLHTVVSTDMDTICENSSIQFTSNTTGGTAPYTYAWVFGDGGTATNMNETHTYTTAGTYTISLLVTDDANATTDTTFDILVKNCTTPALHQTSTTDLDTVCLGNAIQFSTTATGGTSPYTYAWSFGDGSTATTMNEAHTYAAIGNYTVTLTVTDDANATVDTTILVVVENCATPALHQTSTTDLDTVCLGSDIQFSTTATGGTSPYTYAWAFGDGSTATTMSGTHTYSTVGDYSVTLTITDDASATVDTTISIFVGDCSSIKENNGASISIYPNPTSNGFVTLANIENNSLVTIYNVIGESVLNIKANNNDVLNVTNLVKGNYFISISSNNSITTKKLIIK